jgi:hypothetical protein
MAISYVVEIITNMRIIATSISQKTDKIVKVRIRAPKNGLKRAGNRREWPLNQMERPLRRVRWYLEAMEKREWHEFRH